jgi:hypothetical protein
MSYQCRVLTRILLIPFSLPPCGPTDTYESKAYRSLYEGFRTHKYSSAVGWVVRQGEVLESNHERLYALRDELQTLYPVMNSRNLIGWAACLFILEQVTE